MSLSFVLAGGGTGGHVFPLLAVADTLRNLDDSHQVLFVGTRRGLEARVVPENGYDIEFLDISPIRGSGVAGAAGGVAKAVASMPASVSLIRRRKPDIVLSVGGYAAGPVTLAAWTLGVPTALLEPNSEMGLSNWALTAFVDRAYTAFHSVERHFSRSRVLRAGVPLRPGFDPRPWVEHEGPIRLLVLGGSQGASSLNELIPELRRTMNIAVDVRHQCGRAHIDHVRELYAGQQTQGLRLEAFIDDMPEALAWADIVISRSGASALGEICALGRASVLIPYPYAAGDHQAKNARVLAQAGAAVCLEPKNVGAKQLRDVVLELAREKGRIGQMSWAAQHLGRPDAAMTIATDMIALARTKTLPTPPPVSANSNQPKVEA